MKTDINFHVADIGIPQYRWLILGHGQLRCKVVSFYWPLGQGKIFPKVPKTAQKPWFSALPGALVASFGFLDPLASSLVGSLLEKMFSGPISSKVDSRKDWIAFPEKSGKSRTNLDKSGKILKNQENHEKS